MCVPNLEGGCAVQLNAFSWDYCGYTLSKLSHFTFLNEEDKFTNEMCDPTEERILAIQALTEVSFSPWPRHRWGELEPTQKEVEQFTEEL